MAALIKSITVALCLVLLAVSVAAQNSNGSGGTTTCTIPGCIHCSANEVCDQCQSRMVLIGNTCSYCRDGCLKCDTSLYCLACDTTTFTLNNGMCERIRKVPSGASNVAVTASVAAAVVALLATLLA
ncbi:hypothetical protein, conserved [Angomonas deanei]|uniref:Surface antigen-like protein n=2 Tax=Angomonas deanei TaxID=59799 RepID=A0A7G2CE25_9TRYP|nr:hypothetical protein, conserved [Angomonas deanei]CAD2218097.1 hypothetical protein, conserved [Angomonas deanei]CAD2218099.1 hypothetical protein, conserved [Angomonas deanei]CAD2218100.1 hypothetical protein, conserved [Angomonas deanei]CAD2218105.1 hypothetical protein, conserved [Angomonas deanei]